MHDVSSTKVKFCKLLTGTIPNMPKTNSKADLHIQKAMGFLKSFQNMVVLLAMKLANFTPQEQACHVKQMWIRCRFDKKAFKHTTIQMSPPTTSVSIDLADNNGGLSSVRVLESVTDPPPESPPKKAKRVYWPEAAMQAHCTKALKKATV
jgi:hypothetical protein